MGCRQQRENANKMFESYVWKQIHPVWLKGHMEPKIFRLWPAAPVKLGQGIGVADKPFYAVWGDCL